jgi:hypothetical protein
MTPQTLTPIELFQRFLAQRAAVQAGDTDEAYHLRATAGIINATFFEDPQTFDELETWCRTKLERKQQP